MYPPKVPDVLIYSGDHTVFPSYTIKEDGVAVDLSGYTNWQAQWRKSVDASTSIPLTVDTTQLALGVFTVSATSAQTTSMAGGGVWDIQAESPEGHIRTFMYGATKWRKDVTRA